MTRQLSEEICESIRHVGGSYHRLLLVVGPPNVGKTRALQGVAQLTGAPVVNVNLELSRSMLELTERQRPLRAQRLLEQILTQTAGDLILLDNTEILFDVSLKQDPLRLLQGLSRSRTLVATWSGTVEGKRIYYAAPGHPEHKWYPLDGTLVVSREALC